MIIWLASYPKSGNTWIRSFLASLLFNKNNKADLNGIFNIPQYPLRIHFKNLVNNIDDIKEISSKWVKSQSIINSDKKIKFFKTHHALCNYQGNNFTNIENTLGVIHIVRDPRNIISSILYHYSKDNYKKALEFILDENKALGKKFDEKSLTVNRDMFTIISSWKNHYNSWKNFKKNYLLIKYEDLLYQPDNEFGKICSYLTTHLNIKFDDEKIYTAIKENNFENLKKLERNSGFKESIRDKSTGEIKKFFNLGPHNKWENVLDKEIKNSIESNFQREMNELGYL